MKNFGSTFGSSNGFDRSNGHDGNGHSLEKRPGDIEEEIQLTRARMQSTIEAIKKDLSPGQIVDQVMHSFKDGKVHDVATSTFSSVGHIVRENPLPAALIGVGIVWLAASSGKKTSPVTPRVARAYTEGAGLEQGIYSEGELYSQQEGYGVQRTFESQRTEGTYGGSYEGFEGVDEGADIEGGSEGGRLAHAKEKVGSIAHGAREKIGGVGSKMSSKIGGARSKISGATHGAASKIGGAASYSKHKVSAGAVRAKQQAVRAKDKSVQTFDAQPLVIGAIAIGVGALLGSLVPATQREDQLMGAKRDQLKKKADEVGAQVLGRVKETVEQGAQKVKGKLEHQQQAQSASSDVGNIAMGASAGAVMGSVANADLGMADLGNMEATAYPTSYPTQASAGTFANRGDVEVPQQSGPRATLDDDEIIDDPDTFGGP